MNTDDRPNPDELLEAIKREEIEKAKGRLKIFLGMAAGVGKTYSMLREAQERVKEHVDVVAGIVDTHGRQDTAALVEGLKIIPEKVVNYRGREFLELDLDEIIRLKPKLVLVDELAHTNVPGLRHPKRWQDVMEILENGIDVYTTLNVQHIESLNDIVEGITKVSVRETVPDLVVEKAANIQLVDLIPEELLQRLKEGKVYLGEQSAIAAQNFFQKDRLTALREIVLRYTAEKVDRDLHDLVTTSEKVAGWKTHEKLLVAVNESPLSQKLIRSTRRLAFNLEAPWVAVYVDTGKHLNESENNSLSKNLALARDLGAEVITTHDPDIATGILRISNQAGVTQIVIGRSSSTPLFGIFQRNTLLEKLTNAVNDVDIHVIKQEKLLTRHRDRLIAITPKKQLTPYLYVFGCVLLLTGINWLALPYLGYKIIGVIFLIGILFLSLFFKKGPIFFASILYALIWGFFFIPPAGTIEVMPNEDNFILALYFLTAIATGILVDRSREHQEMLSKREESTLALYNIVRQIAGAPSTQEIFKPIKKRLDRLFKGSFEIVIKQLNDGLALEKTIPLLNNEKEIGAAVWVFEHGREAGWSTDTLPSAQNYYLPLKGFQEVVGVLIFRPGTKRGLSSEEKNFLYTVSQQLANHLERSFAEERSKQNDQLVQIEKIHRTILDRILQVFKEPLQAIRTAIIELKNNLAPLESPAVKNATVTIENNSENLSKALINVSAMAQLSEGMLPLNKDLHNIRQLIEYCCDNLKNSLNSHKVKISITEELPLVEFDFQLFEMLLNNLIGNAIEYSPRGSTIEIEAKTSGDFLILSVSDEGKGIPEDQFNVIFEKFYRMPESPAPGVGLGLPIAKTIAEIHQGYLKAENRLTGGAKFSVFLPINNPKH